MENSEKIGDRLRKYRESLNLGQKEFAEKLGISAHTVISRLEKNHSTPSAETLQRIAESFNIDLHWLITGQPAPSSSEHSKALFYDLYNRMKIVLETLPILNSEHSAAMNKVNELETKQQSGQPLTDKEQQQLIQQKGIVRIRGKMMETLFYIQNRILEEQQKIEQSYNLPILPVEVEKDTE